jgi:YidC/Oxa1 family membrane protein insertase
MEKNTLIAVVLSVVIIVGGMVLQSVFFPPAAAKTEATAAQPAPTVQPVESPSKPATPSAAALPVTGEVRAVPEESSGDLDNPVVRETDVFRLAFSHKGGELTSVQLKNYKNADGSLVEMILADDSGQHPFGMSFGDYRTEEIHAAFKITRDTYDAQGVQIEFTADLLAADGIPFQVKKTYLFFRGEYLMELRISITNTGGNAAPSLNYGGTAYTLGFGPQIGPVFKKLDGRNDYRNFVTYADGKRKDVRVNPATPVLQDLRVTWAAVVGKYFTVIAVPDATQYRMVFDARTGPQGQPRATLYLVRPSLKSARTTDTYRYYIGPKKREILSAYNDPKKNALSIGNLKLDETVTSQILIGWLATLLRWVLQFFYMLIPNYGVAIILLTLLTKVLFFPMTFKSSDSTSRMQALNPKINEIRERLKNKPERMNQEIAELYKKEKINPLSGCLPLLLQMPIFFALYALLNDYFDLRGALFIPGWIPDLSAPESILDFAPAAIPLLGWQNLRLLPFVMLATQFLQTKFTQTPDASNQQMKLLGYAMPAVFFFILYDMPSGLVLYWTVQNVLSIVQQAYINGRRKKKDVTPQK